MSIRKSDAAVPPPARRVKTPPIEVQKPVVAPPLADKPAEELGGVADAKAKKTSAVAASPQAIQADQAKSETVARDVRQGLEASVSMVSGEGASQTRIDQQKAIRDSHAGKKVAKNELRPEYKAAVDIGKAFLPDVASQVGGKVDAKLREKAPGVAAAKDAMAPHVNTMIEGTMAELLKNPAAMSQVTSTVNLLGKEGFQAAMQQSGGHVADAFTKATGTALMDPEATTSALLAFPKLVGKLLPGKAEAATAMATSIGSKLGLAEKLAHGAVGAKGAATAVQGAEAAAQVGAQVGAKGATAAAQAIPGLNIGIGIATTTLAAGSLVKELCRKPRHGTRIAAEAGNTLLQAAGILFPFVGLIGTVGKLGVDRAIKHHDDKAGRQLGTTEALDKAKAMAPAVHTSLEALESVFQGAENPAAAARMQSLRGTSKKLEEAMQMVESGEHDSPELKKAQAEHLAAMTSTLSQELHEAAGEAKGPEKEALHATAQGFGKLFATLKKHGVLEKQKKMPGGEISPEDEKTKRAELQGEVVGVLKDVLISLGALAAAKKQSGAPAAGEEAAA